MVREISWMEVFLVFVETNYFNYLKSLIERDRICALKFLEFAEVNEN